jgi:leader peptidase (prepilin peptidase)/N-methyltransferase
MSNRGRLPNLRGSTLATAEGVAILPLALAFMLTLLLVATPVAIATKPQTGFLVVSAVLAMGLSLLASIDIREQRLPDVLTLPMLILGLAATPWIADASLWWSVLSALIGYAGMLAVASGYQHLRGEAGLGRGDAKLVAGACAWVGLQALPTLMLIASLSALGVAACSHARGRTFGARDRIPFGPFLALGTWIVWLYGPL